MIYEYQNTIITVRPGLGGDNYATCKLKPNGSWTAVKTPAMPRTTDMTKAINNLHNWAKQKGLRRADCGCCFHHSYNHCNKYNKALETVEVVIFGEACLRCPECDELEKLQGFRLEKGPKAKKGSVLLSKMPCPKCGKPMENFAVKWGWNNCYKCSWELMKESEKK